MADYWVQTNEDMNPIRVNGVSDSEMNGILKLLQALASEGELVCLTECNSSEEIYDNYDEWSASRKSVNSGCSIKASEDKITYVVFFNGEILGTFDDYNKAEYALKDEINETIAMGAADSIDFSECWIEDEYDEEVMYIADGDDDYTEYL